MAAVEVDGVSRWYGNVVAVNDVSFTLGTGDHGPAGAERRREEHVPAHDGRIPAGFQGSGPDPRASRRSATPTSIAQVGLVPEREAVYSFLSGYEFVLTTARCTA